MKTALEELQRIAKKWGSLPAQTQLKTLEEESIEFASAKVQAKNAQFRAAQLEDELSHARQTNERLLLEKAGTEKELNQLMQASIQQHRDAQRAQVMQLQSECELSFLLGLRRRRRGAKPMC